MGGETSGSFANSEVFGDVQKGEPPTEFLMFFMSPSDVLLEHELLALLEARLVRMRVCFDSKRGVLSPKNHG